jgi:hypothetical protein
MEYHSAVAELKPTAKIMLIVDLAHERNLDLKTEEGRQHIQSERMAAELVVIFPAILRMLDAGLTVAARVTRSKSIRLKKKHLTEDWWLAFIEEGHRAVKSAHRWEPLGTKPISHITKRRHTRTMKTRITSIRKKTGEENVTEVEHRKRYGKQQRIPRNI